MFVYRLALIIIISFEYIHAANNRIVIRGPGRCCRVVRIPTRGFMGSSTDRAVANWADSAIGSGRDGSDGSAVAPPAVMADDGCAETWNWEAPDWHQDSDAWRLVIGLIPDGAARLWLGLRWRWMALIKRHFIVSYTPECRSPSEKQSALLEIIASRWRLGFRATGLRPTPRRLTEMFRNQRSRWVARGMCRSD